MTDSVMQEALPVPAIERRDDIGRLVAVTWHGAGARAGENAGSARWLVAVDGSDCSLRAVAMVAGLAALERTEVDLVHVRPWLNKEAAETELPQRGWAATATARQLVESASVRWRLHVVMGEAAPEIEAMADALGSRGIATGSHGVSAVDSMLLGSVAYKIVHIVKKTSILLVR
ncbi:MAG: universal stress protein [Polaromonas sp.]|nr:universal stress protein [Polaromonas sp.]